MAPKLKTILLAGIIVGAAFALLQTFLIFREPILSGVETLLWKPLPQPLQILISSSFLWWLIIGLAGIATYLAYRLRLAVRGHVDGGSRVLVWLAGGGGEGIRAKVIRVFAPAVRATIHTFGVYPDDKRTDAIEPWRSRLSRQYKCVEVPPGQANMQAALAAHEGYATVYRPLLQRSLSAVSRVVAVFHMGGYTGSVASINASKDIAAAMKETVVVVMGDSPEPLVAAISNPLLYANARRATHADVQYAWTNTEPRIVEVSS